MSEDILIGLTVKTQGLWSVWPCLWSFHSFLAAGIQKLLQAIHLQASGHKFSHSHTLNNKLTENYNGHWGGKKSLQYHKKWIFMNSFKAFELLLRWKLNPVQLPSGSGVWIVFRAAPRLHSCVFMVWKWPHNSWHLPGAEKPPTPESGPGLGTVHHRPLATFQKEAECWACLQTEKQHWKDCMSVKKQVALRVLEKVWQGAGSLGLQQELGMESQYGSTSQTSQTTSVTLGRGGGWDCNVSNSAVKPCQPQK